MAGPRGYEHLNLRRARAVQRKSEITAQSSRAAKYLVSRSYLAGNLLALAAARQHDPTNIARRLIPVQPQFVEYKRIRYTVRIGTERGRWAVAIHAAGVETSARFCFGCREEAERKARAMIDRWLERHPRRRRGLAQESASDAERKF
jgi:hypothetical protein